MLTPAFHFTILQQFIPVFFNHANLLVEKLLCLENKDSFDVVPHLTEYTLHTICGKFCLMKFDKRKYVSKFVCDLYYNLQKLQWELVLI